MTDRAEETLVAVDWGPRPCRHRQPPHQVGWLRPGPRGRRGVRPHWPAQPGGASQVLALEADVITHHCWLPHTGRPACGSPPAATPV
ncbi:hypothetical protein V2J94_45400 [Streptomyces sp. DSM 41524]|uniref:Uncharacterized protein n=1 Tax=Streptomyces asiaticus subsp. ignotus TaxID=3098222 RepID=A0ABU7QC60_9ACTN|nr:hypothetical protein [Streptomyces sp. DSM 41524]